MGFDIGDIGRTLANIGLPLLGAALPVPGGTAIGVALAKAIGSPSDTLEDVVKTLASNDPEALRVAREFERRHEETLLTITTQHEINLRKQDSIDIAAVNATMRSELENSAGEAWYQKAWRPACGFAVATGSFMAVYFVCRLFADALAGPDNIATVVSVIPQLATSVAMILGVPGAATGIAAWHRGMQKREQRHVKGI